MVDREAAQGIGMESEEKRRVERDRRTKPGSSCSRPSGARERERERSKWTKGGADEEIKFKMCY